MANREGGCPFLYLQSTGLNVSGGFLGYSFSCLTAPFAVTASGGHHTFSIREVLSLPIDVRQSVAEQVTTKPLQDT
jgi:hypothetical protein